jgi:hypothetical protein
MIHERAYYTGERVGRRVAACLWLLQNFDQRAAHPGVARCPIVYIVGITFLKEACDVAAAPVGKKDLFAGVGIPADHFGQCVNRSIFELQVRLRIVTMASFMVLTLASPVLFRSQTHVLDVSVLINAVGSDF